MPGGEGGDKGRGGTDGGGVHGDGGGRGGGGGREGGGGEWIWIIGTPLSVWLMLRSYGVLATVMPPLL